MKAIESQSARPDPASVSRTRPATATIRWLWAALLLLASPMAFASASLTTKIEASSTYEDKAVTLQARLFRPEGDGPFPAVVLMHGCGGLSPAVLGSMRRYGEQFRRHGFVALVLDSFGPRGNQDGWVCERYERLMKARIYRVSDALDALAYLRTLDYVDGDHVFQMGQSNGGSVAIRLAQLRKPAFRAVAAYYPWCGTFNRLGSKAEIGTPLIVLAGALDDWTPPGDCQTIKSTGADYRVVVYPGAVHSFDLEISRQQYQGHAVGFDRAASEDSFRQMLGFFHAQLDADLRASLPAPVMPAESAEIVYLTGEEIEQLMPSGLLKGVNSFGNPYTIAYTEDGNMSGVAGHRDEYRDTGKWWVEEDLFCRQYKAWLEGKAACFKVHLDGDDIGFYDSDDSFVSGGRFERGA